MNEFLESKNIIVVDGTFDPSKKFRKDWIPAGIHFEVKEDGAEFFTWESPGKKNFYTVPLEILFQTNPVKDDSTIPEGYPSYRRPHDELPQGDKLVWDVSAIGAMKIVPINADTRSQLDRIEEKVDAILAVVSGEPVG
jgi:hypothetical protein